MHDADTKKTYMDAMRDMHIAVDCMLLCLSDESREEFTLCIQNARVCTSLCESTLDSLNILVDTAVARLQSDSVRTWWRRVLGQSRHAIRLAEPSARDSEGAVGAHGATARVTRTDTDSEGAVGAHGATARVARADTDSKKRRRILDRVYNASRYDRDAPARAEFARRRQLQKMGAVVPAAVTTTEVKADKMLATADAYNLQKNLRQRQCPRAALKVGDRVEVLFPKVMYRLPDIGTGYKATVAHVVAVHGYLVELDDAAAAETVRTCHLKTSRHRTFPAHLMQCGLNRLRLVAPAGAAEATLPPVSLLLNTVSVAMLPNQNSMHVLAPLRTVFA